MCTQLLKLIFSLFFSLFMFNILRQNSYSFMVEGPVDFDRFLNPSPEKGQFQVENKISSY